LSCERAPTVFVRDLGVAGLAAFDIKVVDVVGGCGCGLRAGDPGGSSSGVWCSVRFCTGGGYG